MTENPQNIAMELSSASQRVHLGSPEYARALLAVCCVLVRKRATIITAIAIGLFIFLRASLPRFPFPFPDPFRFRFSREHTNALQGLSKPSDSSPPIAFPSSELDKLRDLPVWKTLSGKRVAVDRNRHFSLAEGGGVADLPLPPGASDR